MTERPEGGKAQPLTLDTWLEEQFDRLTRQTKLATEEVKRALAQGTPESRRLAEEARPKIGYLSARIAEARIAADAGGLPLKYVAGQLQDYIPTLIDSIKNWQVRNPGLLIEVEELRAPLSEMEQLLGALAVREDPEGGSEGNGVTFLGAGELASGAREADNTPVYIYLSDEGIHGQVEAAVEQWLATAHLSIVVRDEPVIGSWFRRMAARARKAARTPDGQDALLTARHVADSRLVQQQDAYVTSMLLQNVGPVLGALQPTRDAVIRTGALLILKIDWVVSVYQLTAAQQAVLDHEPKLAAAPREVIDALVLKESQAQHVGQSDASSEPDNEYR